MDNVQWTKSVIESMYKSAHGFFILLFVCLSVKLQMKSLCNRLEVWTDRCLNVIRDVLYKQCMEFPLICLSVCISTTNSSHHYTE